MAEEHQLACPDTWSGWIWPSIIETWAFKLEACTLAVSQLDLIPATCKSLGVLLIMTDFSNWRDANTTVAGGWGMDIDRLRVSGKVIDGGQYYVSHQEI